MDTGNGKAPETLQPCPRCQQIKERLSTRDVLFSDVFTLSDLKRSPCETCQAMHRACLKTLAPGQTFSGDAGLFATFEPGNFWIRPFSPRDRKGAPMLGIYCSPALPCPWDMFPTRPDLTRAASDEYFDKALGWVRNCVAHHSCGSSVSIPRLPTRVLEIGPGKHHVRLAHTSGSFGRYMCLSHCWGGHQPLRTLKGNIESHLRSLPWRTIPKTYQHALEFARLLGIRYLWIDSLCIIQDDSDDWVRESSVMGQIYRDAYLTIAATTSKNADCGIFPENLEVSGTTHSGNPYRLHIIPGKYIKGSPEEHIESIMTREEIRLLWPLLDRGWVFQERLLTPRMLHLGSWEMMWECDEITTCECGNLLPQGKENFRQLVKNSTKENLHERWREVICQYTTLSFTFGEDNLPALSGIAKEMAAKRPDAQYLAGLWSDSLIIDLLWVNVNSFESEEWATDRSLKNDVPPSWSWASLKIRVAFPFSQWFSRYKTQRVGQIVHQYVDFHEVHCDISTADPTGKVRGGCLSITAPVVSGSVLLETPPEGARFAPKSRLSINGLPPVSLERGYMINLDNPYSVCASSVAKSVSVIFIRMARVRACTIYEGTVESAEEMEYSLIAVPTTGETAQYRRIGLVVEERTDGIGEIVWKMEPSVFEEGTTRMTLTLV